MDYSESTPFAKPVEEWKKKKGWGPVALLTVVLLGLAFLAGTSVQHTTPLRTAGSLSSTGGMSTLGVPDNVCGVGLTPKSCPLGQETWSVSGGFQDKSKCLSDTGATEICGELCIDPSFLLEFISYMPFSPKPQQGSCYFHGFETPTGKTFNLSLVTNGHIGLDSYIFTKKK